MIAHSAHAILLTPTLIKVDVFPLSELDDVHFDFFVNHHKDHELTPKQVVKNAHEHYYLFELDAEIILGNDYHIVCEKLGALPVNVSPLAQQASFDEHYAYSGNDLGATYTPTHTCFVIWAPLASKVVLKYVRKNRWCLVEMKRTEKGVYRVTLKGNFDGVPYLYEVTNNSVSVEVSDPYAKLSLANNQASIVANPRRYRLKMNDKFLPPFQRYTDAIIYETHVRDMTIDESTNIHHKGTFLGLIETGRKTKDGHPAGFDYIKALGITHLQLMPIFDYATVDERNPLSAYNWGYDPAQYFVPEGSYASKIDDPYSRIVDLKKMVSAFHRNGIRIIMDIVFNHVYEYQTSVFERVVPNYYFRYEKDGQIASRSFCGNDLATQRYMVRKLIVDACVYYVREFGVDGFRFDIMGLIDLETIKAVQEAVKHLKPGLMIYGEGWQMGDENSQNTQMASFTNSFQMAGIGFFNDWYRDIMRGRTSDHDQSPRGYLLNSEGHREGFKYAYKGSSFEQFLTRRFINPNQSINYVECHDNGTIFDKLETAMPEENLEAHLERLKLINAVVLSSYGVPFIHMGQEIGLSKKNHQNTYKAGDSLNKMDYQIVDERYEILRYTQDMIALRKKLAFLREDDVERIAKMIDFEELGPIAIKIIYHLEQSIDDIKDLLIFVNPGVETIYHDLDEYYQILFASGGNVLTSKTFVKHVMIKGRSFLILIK